MNRKCEEKEVGRERYFRLTVSDDSSPGPSSGHLAPLVDALLLAQGFCFEPEPYHSGARRLLGGPLPLGSSLAARFGYIYIQDPSSMLPPLALAPVAGASVLDMCASPGGKTGLLSLLCGGAASGGLVLANEASPKRLATLRRNLEAQNLLNCATVQGTGEKSPLAAASFSDILLDPPCSGWGTADKHPKVLELWTGDKIKTLTGLQRLLLKEAWRLLAPGGRLVYSTCTTNPDENEEQILWAVRELAGLEILPLAPPPGFSFDAPARSGCDGVLRVAQDSPRGQGFFIAALGKKNCPSTFSPAGGPFVIPSDSPPGVEAAVLAPALRLSEAALLNPANLDAPLVDSSLLPPGAVAICGSYFCFFPRAAFNIALAAEAGGKAGALDLRGLPLGKTTGGGVKPSPRLRCLMPAPDEARKRGAAILDVEEPEPILKLLSGQSLRVDKQLSELGLYFRGLPLCRLRASGGRALLAL